MATFFDQVTVSFADVPTSNGVEVAKFLAATEDLIKLFGTILVLSLIGCND